MTTVSDGIRPGGECQHPDTYRCRETCECLCVPCWNKRHVTQEQALSTSYVAAIEAVLARCCPRTPGGPHSALCLGETR